MKKTIIFIALGFTIILVNCKKEKTEELVITSNQTDPCKGDDGFCMIYGGSQKSGSAKLFVYNQNKVRVFWEKGSSTNFEQIELDIYGLIPGTYNVDNLAISGNSAFIQYYSQSGGVINPAYGSVIVSELDTNGNVTGTFTATMEDSTKITNGIFTNISK
jgi:hypothetical protein